MNGEESTCGVRVDAPTQPLPAGDPRVSALRWLLNITTEFDRKDVRTRQAARLLDEFSGGDGRTNRELLEDLWRLVSGTDGVKGHQNSCSKSSSSSIDTDDAPLVEHQLSSLLEGIGASEDHEDAIAFFTRGGISTETAKRLVAALALHRFVPVDVLRAYGVDVPLKGQ